jgi:hypothetical protein
MKMTKLEIFKAEIDPLMDQLYLTCKKHDMSMLAFVHTPTEEVPTLTQGVGVMFHDVPETMQKIVELVKTREVVEVHPTPVESCDNNSVTS